ncbi:MAG: UDP-N-acetylglucosamine 2-epimerase, partial [Candidatus Staskawiczbacteria bacterium]
MTRKIAVLTGARAEYGILSSLMTEIKQTKGLELLTLVTGSHLVKEYGYSISEIIKDGFKPDAIIPMYPKKLEESTNNSLPIYLGVGLKNITLSLSKLKPDLLIVFGDRGEAFMGAVAAAYLNIPVAHIHGGDQADGLDIDDSLRHAITKLAHIHFPATPKSRQRIIQ